MVAHNNHYQVSKDTPLISSSQPTRHLIDKSVNIDHSTAHALNVAKESNKNNVVMANLTYKHTPQVIENYIQY